MAVQAIALLLFARLVALELQSDVFPAVEAPGSTSTTVLPAVVTPSSFVAMATDPVATVTVSTTLTLVTPAIDATSSLLLTTTVPTSTSSSLAGEANAAVVMPAPMPVLADAFPAQAAAQASAAAPAAAPEPANPATLTMSTTVSTINPTFSLSLSTLWVPVTLADGATMWVQSTFTQSFAAVPDQGPPPGSGRIGLGSLTVTMRGDGEQAAAVAMGARVGWRGAVVAVGIVGAAMQ